MPDVLWPATHLNQAVSLPQEIGGKLNGQAQIDDMAAILVSNVHGGASAAAGDKQPADNFQILVTDFDVVQQDANGIPVHSVAYVDSSDHVGFKHLTTGLNGGITQGCTQAPDCCLSKFHRLDRAKQLRGDAPTTPSSPMISCSRSGTADTVVGLYGNVVDNLPAYFGDDVQGQTTCHSSVIFGGESIRNTGGDGTDGSLGAITIHSAALVHFAGTKIHGSRIDPNAKTPFYADCVRLFGSRGSGGGRAYFEGGDFSNCSGSGVNIAGNWIAMFIDVPTTSAAGPNGRFGIEAANGAKLFGLGCASNGASPCDNHGLHSLRGKFDPLNLSFDNAPTSFSYDQRFSCIGVWLQGGKRLRAEC